MVLSVIDSINVLSGVKDCTCNDLCCMYKVNKWSNAVESNVKYMLLTQSKVIMPLDDKEKQKEMERNLPVDASLSNGVSRM